ncbi:hypothetical protein QJS10_CPA08g00750 [Acorus calamus]|uniref:Uncharacterized protein n=1 Tax=Acorus calamus TaxID=4465 RepID=A0AAV9ECF0_ACOCL|nr:hypothetical protein QJS10_CPA08g00750 [Acorus calamus]
MRGDKYLMQGISDRDRRWKEEVTVIRGPWQCPVAGMPPIRTSFGELRNLDPTVGIRFLNDTVQETVRDLMWDEAFFESISMEMPFPDAPELMAIAGARRFLPSGPRSGANGIVPVRGKAAGLAVSRPKLRTTGSPGQVTRRTMSPLPSYPAGKFPRELSLGQRKPRSRLC